LRLRLDLPTRAHAVLLQSIAAFALLALAYATRNPTVEIDVWLANALHANAVPSATTALAAVTMFGSTLVLALVAATAGAYLIVRGRGRDAALLGIALVGAQLLGWVLKAIFERPRPSFEDPVATAGWFSFPSGHALSSIALYGALAYVFAGRRGPSWGRILGLGALALLVAAIGFSRLYLGVHYLTDVLAGYSAGVALLLITIGLLHARSHRPAPWRSGSAPGRRSPHR
jgi:membrane-associated phospholipid phosphatase